VPPESRGSLFRARSTRAHAQLGISYLPRDYRLCHSVMNPSNPKGRLRKIIGTRQTTEIGKCIYCGTTKGKLSEEHVAPYGLGGQLVLLQASCDCCAKITSALEQTVLKDIFAARAALRTRTRRPKKRQKTQPMLIEKDGEIKTIQATWQDQWKVIKLPIFPLPAHIDGRPYASGIESTSMDQFELSEKGEEIANRHGANKVLLRSYPVKVFARFIAKMAYGYAVAEYTLNAFEEVNIVPAILGKTDDVGRWVGCPQSRELPRKQCNISVGFKIISRRELWVRLKMFPRFDGAEYLVVIGRVKEIYMNYIHALGRQG
jgi:hypothetical protein